MFDWVLFNEDTLKRHQLYATGTTGGLIAGHSALQVHRLKSGRLGGDQQFGAMIANCELDILIFFWDPMTAQPHDVEVKALLCMSVLYHVAVACIRTSADFMISSTLFDSRYAPEMKDWGALIT